MSSNISSTGYKKNKALNSIAKDFVSLSCPGGEQYPYIANLGNEISFLPSVFSSPYTNSSVCKFILALPTSKGHYTPITSFSSLSTLAFLSVSANIRSRHLLIDLDEQGRVTDKRSMVSALASTLKSLSSIEKPSLEFITRVKGTSRLSAKKKLEKKKKTRKDPLQLERDKSNRTLVKNQNSLSSSQGISYVNEEEIDETSNQIGNGLEKNGKNDPNKIQSISKYLVAGAISTIISR